MIQTLGCTSNIALNREDVKEDFKAMKLNGRRLFLLLPLPDAATAEVWLVAAWDCLTGVLIVLAETT